MQWRIWKFSSTDWCTYVGKGSILVEIIVVSHLYLELSSRQWISLAFFADTGLHKLSADITVPWKAVCVTEIASVWVFLSSTWFSLLTLIVVKVWSSFLGLFSLFSNDSNCFPSSLGLFVWPWWAPDWKPVSWVLAFVQTAGIHGVEEQGGREVPPSNVTYWSDSVSVVLLKLSVTGRIKSRMNVAIASIARAVNK